MEYSFQELIKSRNDLQLMLNKAKERDLKFKLVYAVRKNIKELNKVINEVRESLPQDDPEIEKFINERFQLAVDSGGEEEITPDGTKRIKDLETIDEEKYQKGLEELQKKYKDVIEKQDAINKKRNEILENEKFEIEWYNVKQSFYNDDIQPDELPEIMLDIIEIDEE